MFKRPDQPMPTEELDALRRDVEKLTAARDAEARKQAALIKARVDKMRADAEEQNRQRERKYGGGPCIYCGASMAIVWHGTPGRQWCSECQDDKGFHLGDAEHKSMIFRRIVNDDMKQRQYSAGTLAEEECSRAGFRWFCETPDASPGGWTRWVYVDIQAVRELGTEVLSPGRAPGPKFEAGDPCPRCGCAYLWTTTTKTIVIPKDDLLATHTKTFSSTTCAGCSRFREDFEYHEGLVEVGWWIVGVRGQLFQAPPVEGTFSRASFTDAVEVMGLTWFEHRPISPRENLRKLTLAPFAYLNIDKLREKAYKQFPLQAYWREPHVWAALRAKYGETP